MKSDFGVGSSDFVGTDEGTIESNRHEHEAAVALLDFY
jgi:hypothetical protein